MITPSEIIRTNRRSLSLTISKDGRLIVRAPKRLSLDYIYSFIKQKEKWIINKQKAIINTNLSNINLINRKEYLFCGKSYEKTEVQKIKNIELVEDNILFPANIDEDKEILMALKWYSKMTKEILKQRLNYFADLMQVSYTGVKIDNSKARWGSCSEKAALKFNLRISMLPHKVIDYVIIHELSHLIEFNHSKQFYKIIESIMPDYKKYRAELKNHNFVLRLLR